MSLVVRLILMVTIVVAVTDTVEYIHLKSNPDILTVRYLILVIFITVLPIAISLRYWLIKKR